MKVKISGVFLLLLLTLGFLALQIKPAKKYKVLDVDSKSVICVDINSNKNCDNDERFMLKNVDIFPIKHAKNLNISYYDNKNLGEVSNKYLKQILLNQEVEFASDISKYNEKSRYRYAVMTLNNEDTAKILLKNGLATAYRARDFNPYILDENIEQIYKNIEAFAPLKPKEKITANNACDIIEPRVPNGRFGALEVYFIDPLKYTRPSKRARTSAAQAILHNINNAKSSLDIALYGIEGQKEIYDAIKRAKKRGVKVRVVVDSHPLKPDVYYDTKSLREDFGAVSDNHPFIMHNKFFVIDSSKVIVSSMNISPTGSGGYNSNTVLIINSKTVANEYLEEFNQMHKGKFHNDKEPHCLEEFLLDKNTKISVYFTPAINVYECKINTLLKNSKNEILVSAFYLTHRGIIENLIGAKKRGVSVKVVLDATGASNFKERINYLRQSGVDVKVENWGGKNHEKNILVDGCTFVSGSANFSKSAYEKNDENIVIINNCALGSLYRKRFFALYNSIEDKYLSRFPRAEGFESKYSCFDGIDNDFDGKIDKADEGCKNYAKK